MRARSCGSITHAGAWGRHHRDNAASRAGCLAAKGLKVATGAIVDATIINAPYSRADKARDREMQQTKKGASTGICPSPPGQQD
jgi:hypothetical protein